MTAEEFAARLEELIEDALQGGLPDQAIIAGVEAASEALDEDFALNHLPKHYAPPSGAALFFAGRTRAYWALTSCQFIRVTVPTPAVVPPTGFSVQAGAPEGQWVRLFRLNGGDLRLSWSIRVS